MAVQSANFSAHPIAMQLRYPPPFRQQRTDATDPDGDEITYFWTQQSGPQITEFYDAQQQDLTFIPPQAGTYEFTVIAYDPYDNLPGVSVSVDVYDLDGGEVHSLALKPDGSVWSWGDNDSSQIGDGTIDLASSPLVCAPLGPLHRCTAVDIASRLDGVAQRS